MIVSYEIAVCQRDSIFVHPSLSTHASNLPPLEESLPSNSHQTQRMNPPTPRVMVLARVVVPPEAGWQMLQDRRSLKGQGLLRKEQRIVSSLSMRPFAIEESNSPIPAN